MKSEFQMLSKPRLLGVLSNSANEKDRLWSKLCFQYAGINLDMEFHTPCYMAPFPLFFRIVYAINLMSQ